MHEIVESWLEQFALQESIREYANLKVDGRPSSTGFNTLT